MTIARHAAITLTCLIATPVHAEPILADRPGIKADAETLPSETIQVEVGTDTKQVRLGITDRLEVDADDTSEGVRYALLNGAKGKITVKLSYDRDLGVVAEVPVQYTFSKWFYVGGDVAIAQHSRTYIAEFNLTPNDRVTITQAVYYDTKPRYGIFVAWIPPRHDSLQFDAGFDRNRFVIGVSVALDLHQVFRGKP